MKNKYLLTIFISIMNLSFIKAQVNVKEEVYVQIASTDLIVGESINFSTFAYSQLTNKLSDLSKLLYVELINEEGTSVYQTKIAQSKGRGYGKIFISNDFKTGNYHLVAYTRWMMNFNDFFRQRITIVNPYKTLNLEPVDTAVCFVQFYPEGGHLILGVENRMVINFKDAYERGKNVHGKIVSPEGEKIIDVRTDGFGYFDCKFTPTSLQKYQLILESKGDFEFIDIPKAEKGIALKVIHQKSQLLVNIEANDVKDTNGWLEVFKKDELVLSQQISIPDTLIIDSDKLPKGLLQFIVKADQKYERLVWNEDSEIDPNGRKNAYPKITEIDIPLSLPDSLSYSLSITRKHCRSTSISIRSINEIVSGTTVEFPFELTDFQNSKLIDRFLLTAKSSFEHISVEDVLLLPEHRHGLIQGTVFDSTRTPIANVQLGMALRGDVNYISGVVSDSMGHFALRYEPKNGNLIGNVIPVNSEEDYIIEIASEYYDNYPKFENPRIFFDSISVAQIIRRSISNQLENSYQLNEYSNKLIEAQKLMPDIKSYRLEDYTRFKSMRDTFIEIVGEVVVKKNENNFDLFLKTPLVTEKEINNHAETLLLLDGVFARAEDILNINPLYVEKIDVVQKKYFFGKVMVNGIISVYSTSGDGLKSTPLGKSIRLSKTQMATNFQEYQNIDYRQSNQNDQLLWQPMVQHGSGEINIKFNTSKIIGTYSINIDGITPKGEMFHSTIDFEVE